MKWSIFQLQKISNFPYHFEETLDFSNDVSNIEDIISISAVQLTGQIERIDDETYRFKYHMVAPMVLQCALTLDPVDYTLDEEYDEIYTTKESDDYIQIEKQTFDTGLMAWSNIIIDKPISVTLPNAREILKERGIDLDEEIPQDEEVTYYSDGMEDHQDTED